MKGCTQRYMSSNYDANMEDTSWNLFGHLLEGDDVFQALSKKREDDLRKRFASDFVINRNYVGGVRIR